MNKWNDFLNEDPPKGHTDRIMKAVSPELEKLAIEEKRKPFAKWLSGWEGLFTGGAVATAVGGLWFLSQKSNSDEMELMAFQNAVGADSIEDTEFLVSEEDLELLEDLDLLEEMEDV